jgi:hypothetical protein
MEHSCTCGRKFSTQRGMKIHKTKKGCMGLLPDDKQRAVSTDKTLEDLSQGSIHRAENIQVKTSDNELTDLLNGKRDTIKFPPAVSKALWGKLDKELSKELDKHLTKKTPLESKLQMIGDIMCLHCQKEFGVKETKEISAPQKRGDRNK